MKLHDDRNRDSVVDVVNRWHDALNRGDADALVEASHDDVEVEGPRGPARGSDILREWVARAGIQLVPRRWFVKDGAVVVEQTATWRGEDGQPGPPMTVASLFLVESSRVRRIARYDTLATALAETGLATDDELREHNS